MSAYLEKQKLTYIELNRYTLKSCWMPYKDLEEVFFSSRMDGITCLIFIGDSMQSKPNEGHRILRHKSQYYYVGEWSHKKKTFLMEDEPLELSQKEKDKYVYFRAL